MPDPIPESYADCIHLPCRNCEAPAGRYCINPINKFDRGTPCFVRITDAKNQHDTKDR